MAVLFYTVKFLCQALKRFNNKYQRYPQTLIIHDTGLIFMFNVERISINNSRNLWIKVVTLLLASQTSVCFHLKQGFLKSVEMICLGENCVNEIEHAILHNIFQIEMFDVVF